MSKKQVDLEKVALKRKFDEVWSRYDNLLSALCDIEAFRSTIVDRMAYIRDGKLSFERFVAGLPDDMKCLSRASGRIHEFNDVLESAKKSLCLRNV